METAKKPKIRFKGFTNAWEPCKFKEIYEINNEKNEGQYPVEKTLSIATMTINEEGNGADVSSLLKYKVLRIGDLAFEGHTNKEFRYGRFVLNNLENGIMSPRFTSLRPIIQQDFNFWEYYIHSERVMRSKLVKATKAGTMMNELVPDDLFRQTISTPSIAEQTKIGKFLKQIDKLLTLHQRKCEKLQNIKKSLLEKMFPKNNEKFPAIRFKGFTNAWEQNKLSNLTTMHARIGWQNLRTSEFLDTGEYMLITGTDFVDGNINYSTCHYVKKERYMQDKNIQIKNGSILITKDGTLGKVAYVENLTMPATLNAGVFNVEIKDKILFDEKYVYQYLKAPFLMDYVTKKATGGTIKHLNQNILVDFPVIAPNKKEQEKLGEYFSSIDKLLTLHQRQVEKLQNIKKALLEKMFV